ncbi:MAG: SpoIIE family protein phosphatase [Verrucomicrobia bacterium]|nr:SpoIIE family protein phosphatase [Verrucomicrobiota bacterium]MBU4291988.1 SpoIIE family protein phosphatase [Verrucomicrobiota bacterium]MBU4497917.1 SpoIIE family protein phosphatase [Verrucomicrobiota bacterium]MCG2680757.1 SpoIIE family protein phosphatase [Kiritimatiellia bacterium]
MAILSLAGQSWVKRLAAYAAPAVFVLVAAGVAAFALRQCFLPRAFHNPIAYTMVGDSLYVLEKERNTILQFDQGVPGTSLKASGRFRIEPDDERYYYMVRKLYPGPNGIVVHSYIYDQKTRGFLGYRFREYSSFYKPPRPLLTVLLNDPSAYPEIKYACDREGNHYFVNNCAAHRNIWKMPASAWNVIVSGTNLPPVIKEMGDRNETLSGWTSIVIGPDDHIYVTSSASERIVEYASDGWRLREIGAVGLGVGDLLAPDEVFFLPFTPDKPPYLTVASAGNRSWVQFDTNGAIARVVVPLQAGYPYSDILVGHVYATRAAAEPAPTGSATAESAQKVPAEEQFCSFDLVNKCFVVLGRNLTIISSYRAWEVGRTCWLGGIVILLLLLATTWRRLTVFLARMKIPFFVKLLLLFVPLLIISLLVVGDWVRDIMQADLEAESIRRSANLSRAILNSVALADLEAIQKPEDRGSPAYERVYTTVSRIMDTKHVDFTPKWIIHKIRDGRFYFGISVWRGPVYEPFIVPHARRMFFKVLREKTPQAGRFVDEQGEWFSVLNPILNAAGEVIYILELYRPTEEIERANREAVRQVLAIAGVTALAAIVLVLLFSYFFTRPLRQLMIATERLGKGDFDHPIVVRSRDELRDLAAAFNHMMVDLKRYIADLARSTAEKERIHSELRFAREVQQGIVPKVFPPFPQAANIEIVARMEPAREVGGDYFDFFMIDPDHMGVVIADVSDKGVPAGLFTMIVRTLMRSNAKDNLSAADTVSRMNRQIAADNPASMFVTLFYGVCDLRTGAIVFCNAGHPAPILLRQGRAEPLAASEGHGACVIAGIYDNVEYSEGELVLAEGDTLVLYTDGVTEPIDKAEQMYGEERLLRVLIEDPRWTNRQRCDRVVADVMDHQKGVEQFDDITLLFFKFLGRPPPIQHAGEFPDA